MSPINLPGKKTAKEKESFVAEPSGQIRNRFDVAFVWGTVWSNPGWPCPGGAVW